MNVNPEAQYFSPITPLSEEKLKELPPLDEVLVKGTEDSLKKLQDDLRKIGYRQQFKS